MTKLDKILKKLPEDVAESLVAASGEELKSVIVNAEKSIDEARDQLEANPMYQETKENLKALRSGFSDLKKFQSAKIAYALLLLGDRGE